MTRSLQLLIIALAALCTAVTSQAAIRYVNSTATGTNSGTSWANAHTRLQDALAVAASGDQIWIASGTYKPSTTGNRAQSFDVSSGVGLYGGFVGAESTLTERSAAAAATILSGDLLGNDNGNRGRSEATRLDNTYNVVRVSGASSSVTFDRLTIQSGHSETYGDTYDRGAGIHFVASTVGSVVITNCIIRWNTARSSGGWCDDSNHAFTVTATQLIENQSERGGAAGFGGSFTLQNSAFVGNRTENSRDGYQWGGGLFIANGTGQVINCLFSSNYAAEEGGGVYNHGNATFINCTFYGNSAVRWSSALHDRTNSASVKNCIFWGNSGTTYPISADGGSPGTPVFNSLVQGGYTAAGSTAIISSDPLFANSASPLGADGKLGSSDDGLRLGSGSPAINSGNNTYVPAGTTTDIAGSTRVSGVVDMGAYERVPMITSQPQSLTLAQNASASFTVTVTGIGTLSYQWQKDRLDIPGATSASFNLANAQPWHIGDYTVKVTDSLGSVTSQVATLSLIGVQSGIWKGLVAYYPMNGDANDATLNSVHGLVYSAELTTNKNSEPSSAYNFNGGDQRIEIPSTTSIASPNGTASVWIKLSNLSSSDGISDIFSKDNNGIFPRQWTIQALSSGEMRIALFTQAGEFVADSSKTIVINVWQHLVFSWDGSQIRGFMNGNEVCKQAYTGTLKIGDAPLRLACVPSFGQAITGALDDARVYNRALSSNEVQALYASEATVQFSAHPQSQTVNQGQGVTFSATATGVGTLSYQWQKDGVDIPGATSASFNLATAKPWHIGDYTVKVTDSVGTVSSSPATLSLSGVNSGIWKGLAAYYAFDGDTNDTCLFKFNGTKVNTSFALDRFGRPNGSMYFGSTDSKVSVPNLMSLSENSFSISYWSYRLSPEATPAKIVFDQGLLAESHRRILLVFRSGAESYWPQRSLDFSFWATELHSPSNSTDLGFWENWVVIFDKQNSTRTIFKNGLPVAAMASSSPNTGVGATIGNGNDDSLSFGGNLDDFRIYNRALSAADVQALYASEATIPPVLSNPSSTQISAAGATIGGNVTSDGGSSITERGVVYSATATNADPQIGGTGVVKVITTSTTGAFTIPVTGLNQGTGYSFKAYAINSQGTSYTSVGTFTTLSTNADLSALALSSGSLSPSFASGTTVYTATVSGANSSITIAPTTAQANATMVARINSGTYASVTSGSATLALNVGANIVDVRVTAQDGVTQKIYLVTVTRMMAQLASNVTATQRPGTKLVDITYDLAAPSVGSAPVSLEVSSDGGATWMVPVASATGAVGVSVTPGTGKAIVWDAGSDWLGNYSVQMQYRVVAVDGFSYIPEGSFAMGRTSGDTNGPAPITVTVSRFYIQQTETTKAQWEDVRTWAVNNGYTDLTFGGGKGSNHPVHSVSWWDVVKWCNARSEMEGLTPVYTVSGAVMRNGTTEPAANWSANGYRLPTEAEWEKAARGGVSGKRFPWGTDTISHAEANFNSSGGEPYQVGGNAGYHPAYMSGGTPYTSPVRSFTANGYGLYDMAGNAWEWCGDWYSLEYYTISNGTGNPRGPDSGANRVYRGSSWQNTAGGARCDYRGSGPPTTAYASMGFRPARSSDGIGISKTGSLTLDTRAVPSVTTPTASSIGATGATLGGNVTADGGATITERGVVYSATSANSDPIIDGTGVTKVTGSGTTGVFTAPAITGLTQGTGYSYKAYAINSQGTTYTSVATFTTLSTNADLSALTLSSGTLSPNFASGTTAYAASVSNATTSITVTPTRAQANATIEVRVNGGTYAAVTSGSPSAALLLNVVSNTVDVRVTAQAGNSNIYTITVAREKASQNITFAAISDRLTTESVNLTATGGGSNNPVTFVVTFGPAVITNKVLTFTTSGSVTITASQIGNDNYLAAPDVSRTFNVTKTMATITLGSLAHTFNNTPLAATATTAPLGLVVQFTYDGSSSAPTVAGTYAVVGTINDAMYQGSASGSLVIGKASQAITFAAIADKLTTDSVTLSATGGGSNNPVTFAVTSGPGVITNNVLTFTTSGSVTVKASQSGNDNYVVAPDVSRTFNVTKTMAMVTLGSLAQIFNNTPRVATATTEPSGKTVVFTYAGSSTTPTNAGNYEVVGTINDPIYQGSATGTLVIGKASQAISFAAIADKLTTDSVTLSATGGASNNPVTFAVTSGPGVITNNVLTFTTSGSVTVTASQIGNDNYQAAPDVIRTFNVAKTMATVTLGSLAQTFNNTPRVATATTEPLGKTVVFAYDGSSTPPTNAGSYEVVGIINDPIYQGSATGTLLIGKASQAISIAAIADKLTTDSVNLTATGGGSNNPVTFAVTSGPGAITNKVLTFTASGSVTLTASQAGNDNYLAALDVSRTFNVTKAMATVTLGSLAQTFNNTPRVATASTDPLGLTVEFTYDGSTSAPTNAGSYEVVGTINDPIYQGSATGTLVIGKESQTIAFAAIADKLTTDSITLSATGGGSNIPVTFAVTSGLGVISNNVLTFTTSGSVTITASQVGNDNYQTAPDVSRTFNVTKTMATVTLGSLAQTFNNTPRLASATTEPSGKTVVFTYDGLSTPPANAGSYEVVGTINDPIYQGSATGTLVIGKASQAISFAAIADKLTTDSVILSATGGGSNNPVTFAVTSGPGVITNNVLTFTTSGSATVTASQIGNDNYLAASDIIRTFNVTKTMATVTLGSLAQTFNNTPRLASASTEPAPLAVGLTYNGSSTAPTNAGSYEVVATVNDLIYQGSATGTLVIGKESQTIAFAAIPDKLTTDSVTLSATGGGSNLPVTFAVTSGPGVITNNVLTFTTSGSVTITASQAGNDNYLAAPDVSRTFNVTKTMATVTLGSLAQTFNNTPRAASASTDPLGLTVEFTYDGSSSAPTNAGSYEVIGTINDPIYQGNATGTLVIGKESQTIAFATIADKLTTDSVTLSATGGGSNIPVTFAMTSGPGVLTNNVLTFTASGRVTVKASQAGNADYLAAEEVSRSFNVTKAEAPITLAQLTQVANGTPRSVTNSTMPADLTVTTLYAGSATAPSLPGSYAVTATIEDPIYQGTASGNLTVLGLSGLEQPILSGSTTPVFNNGTDYGNVTLGRVLTRVFTVLNPGSQPVSLSGNPLVEIEGAHSSDFLVSVLPETVIPAGGSVAFELRFAPTQPGIRTARVKLVSAAIANGPITFAVQGFGSLPAPRAQTLSFAPPATVYLSQPSLQLIATASSGLPVSLQVISGPATLGANGVLNLTSAGTVKIEARQAGNGSFAAAPALLRTITVKADPTTLTLVDLIKTYNGEEHRVGIVGANAFDVEVTYRVGTTYREEPPVNAGQYLVKAVAGAVTKTGTLVINPAPLYVNVEDKRRLVGEDNPALTVLFDGFIGTDNLGLVLTKPINLTTTASKTSPVGSYAITSSGGAVTTNYKLVHRPGILVVEGVAGSYEALLKNPDSGLPNGHLTLTVPAASRTFTASLRLGQESAAIAYSGNLTLSAHSRLATATLSKTVAGVAFELKVVLSMFGELNVEVRRAGVLVAGADDGIRLLTLPTGQKSAQEGSYTAILEPALPAGQAVPVGAGWATAKVDATGKMTLTGKLADGTAFTAGVAADVAEKPGYRFFVQPYATLRKDSYVGGSFTLVPHPRLAGKSYVAGSNLTWVKAGQPKDLGYRSGFGPVTSTMRIDPWQAPTTTNRLSARLELGVDGRWQVEHSQTGSLSHVALPSLVAVSATNVVSVVAPLTNTRKWKLTLTPTTGAYSGSFELQELTESRTVNFSGVLRQTATLADDLIGAGHYLLPALKTAPSNEQTSGAVLFWRPE